MTHSLFVHDLRTEVKKLWRLDKKTNNKVTFDFERNWKWFLELKQEPSKWRETILQDIKSFSLIGL